MTEEVKELGFDVGHRRVGRIMRQNRISVVRHHCLATVSTTLGVGTQL